MKWVRFLLAGVFLLAATAKLISPADAGTMFGALPGYWQISLLVGEIVLAAWLLTGALPAAAVVTSIAMLSLFSGAIVLEMHKEHPKPCGCMGPKIVAAYDPLAIRRSLAAQFGADWLLILGTSVVFMKSAKRKEISESGEHKAAGSTSLTNP